MHHLRIDLQEGFRNDTVVVRIDGVEVYRHAGVTMRLSASIADAIELHLARSPVEVKVEILTRALVGTHEIDIERTPHVGVYIEGGEVRFAPSANPFRYL